MTYYRRSSDDLDRGLVAHYPLNDLRRVSTDSIIAHYKMNDDADTADLIDSKGGNTGTFTNGEISSNWANIGKINNSIEFDGTYSINLPSGVGQDFSNGLSISLWVYHAGLVTSNVYGDQQAIIGSQNSSYDNPKFFLSLRNSQYNFRFMDGQPRDVTVTVNQVAATWVHLVGVLNPSDGTIKLYKDGSLVDSDSIGTPSITTFAENLLLGAGHTLANFVGFIDDVRIYDGPLSLSEVQTIYNSGSGTETTELFRETVVARDLANFNDGTITGCTNSEGINGVNPDAMSFDGVDDYINPSDVASTDLLPPLSINLWFKPARLDGTVQYLFWRNDDEPGLRITSSNTLQGSCSGTAATFASTGVLTTDTWYMATYTHDGTTLKIYLDGEFVDSTDEPFTTPNSNLLNFGIDDTSTGRFFSGNMQNVRVYNRALTDGEIKKLYRLKK